MVESLRHFVSDPSILDEAFGRVPPKHVAHADVQLFHYSDSLCSQKVRIALDEKGVPWTSRFVNLALHENFAPDYVRINPRAVVPTLVVDGDVVIDSATIVRFIDAHFAGPALTSSEPAAQAETEAWIAIGDRVPLRAITYRELSRTPGDLGRMMRGMLDQRRDLLERYRDENPDLAASYDAKLRDADDYESTIDDDVAYTDDMSAMETALDALETHLAGREWIGGRSFTLADVVWMPNIARLKLARLDSLWTGGRRPNVEAYWNRLKARPSFATAVRAYNTPPGAPGSGRS